MKIILEFRFFSKVLMNYFKYLREYDIMYHKIPIKKKDCFFILFKRNELILIYQ